MRKDGIPAENAQGRPHNQRRFLRLLALLLAAFALFSAVWHFTAYRPYDAYVSALRAQPGWREDPAFPGCGTDGEGYTCNVARPGFLHWTGNLGIGLPALTLESGEEIGYTDSLLIWPRLFRAPEAGVILYEYDFQADGRHLHRPSDVHHAGGEIHPLRRRGGGRGQRGAADRAPGECGDASVPRPGDLEHSIRRKSARLPVPAGAQLRLQVGVHIVAEAVGDAVLRHRVADGLQLPAGQLVPDWGRRRPGPPRRRPPSSHRPGGTWRAGRRTRCRRR